MIDEGLTPRDVDGCISGAGSCLRWLMGPDYLVLRSWSANDHHGPPDAQ